MQILIVDDNPDGAETLAMLLRIWGHETEVVHNGFRALAAALEHPPEVILLDIGLPGIDGFEVARRLRELPQLAGVRLIACSGYGQDNFRQRAEEVGFDGYLVKPDYLEELEAALKKAPVAPVSPTIAAASAGHREGSSRTAYAGTLATLGFAAPDNSRKANRLTPALAHTAPGP